MLSKASRGEWLPFIWNSRGRCWRSSENPSHHVAEPAGRHPDRYGREIGHYRRKSLDPCLSLPGKAFEEVATCGSNHERTKKFI